MSVGRWCALFRELFAGKKKPCSNYLQLFQLFSCWLECQPVIVFWFMVDMNSDSKFVQVKRVLRPGGRYVCVTLAQKHVIGMCSLSFFLSMRGWIFSNLCRFVLLKHRQHWRFWVAAWFGRLWRRKTFGWWGQTGVLLETLRQGWEICLHQVSEASRDPSSPLQPFLVVATKTNSADIPLVTLLTGDVPHANVMQVIFLSVSLCVCLSLSSLT